MKSLLGVTLGVGEILLIIACAVIVVCAVVTAIVRKVKGKTDCGGDCCSCCGCSHCKVESRQKDNNNK